MDHKALTDRLGMLSAPQLAAYTACNATFVEPVFAAFHGDTPSIQFGSWIDELWFMIQTGSKAKAIRLGNEVRAAPEANADDSNQPAFLAMRALSILSYAILVLTEEEPIKAAHWNVNALISLLTDIDYMLGRSESLAGAWLKAQDGLIQTSAGNVLGLSRDECAQRAGATELRIAALEVAHRRGWPLPGDQIRG